MKVRKVIQQILEKAGEDQQWLADEVGVTQPTVSRWVGGSDPKGEHRDKLAQLARRLGVIKESDPDNFTVPIVGFVGAGGHVEYDKGQGPFGEAEMPPEGGSRSTVAVVVRGDSMAGQLEDGWVVYYDDRPDTPSPNLLGKLCVIGLKDGRVLVKRLYKGRGPGLYDLFSVNAAPIQDQAVEWAAKIIWIKPK